MTITYRTSDGTRWGSGQGSDLSAAQIDVNFWDLASDVLALQEHSETLASIVSATVVGDQLFLTLSNDAVLGPLTLPTAMWNPRGPWLPNIAYSAFDVFTQNGSLYLVTQNISNSGPTFAAGATDGHGHNLYMLLLTQPDGVLPVGGTVGQALTKSTGSPFAVEWSSLFIRIFCQVLGQPLPGELVLQYAIVDHMTIPAALAGSAIFNNTPSAASNTWDVFLNGAAIGSITFDGPSPETITSNFPSDTACVPGDVLTMQAPGTLDASQADISFTFKCPIT